MRYDRRTDWWIFNAKALFAIWGQCDRVLTHSGPAVFHLSSCVLCSQEAPGNFGSRLDTSSPMQRASFGYSLPSSLAEFKIRGWNRPLSDIFSMHLESRVGALLEILTDLWGENCTSFAEMWRGCGTIMGMRKRSLETLTTDSLSSAAPLGIVLLHGCWDVWLGQHHLLPGKSCQWSSLGMKQCEGSSSVCCSPPCYGRTCDFVGNPWGEQTLVFFKTLLCRQGN